MIKVGIPDNNSELLEANTVKRLAEANEKANGA